MRFGKDYKWRWLLVFMHSDLDLDLKNISKIEGHTREALLLEVVGGRSLTLVGGRRLEQLGGFENA